jgi:hypothetical protein
LEDGVALQLVTVQATVLHLKRKRLYSTLEDKGRPPACDRPGSCTPPVERKGLSSTFEHGVALQLVTVQATVLHLKRKRLHSTLEDGVTLQLVTVQAAVFHL